MSGILPTPGLLLIHGLQRGKTCTCDLCRVQLRIPTLPVRLEGFVLRAEAAFRPGPSLPLGELQLFDVFARQDFGRELYTGQEHGEMRESSWWLVDGVRDGGSRGVQVRILLTTGSDVRDVSDHSDQLRDRLPDGVHEALPLRHRPLRLEILLDPARHPRSVLRVERDTLRRDTPRDDRQRRRIAVVAWHRLHLTFIQTTNRPTQRMLRRDEQKVLTDTVPIQFLCQRRIMGRKSDTQRGE